MREVNRLNKEIELLKSELSATDLFPLSQREKRAIRYRIKKYLEGVVFLQRVYKNQGSR